MEVVCPAGSLPALKAAVDQGADAVYIGFRDHTNARQFAGLNFTEKRMREGMEDARSCKGNGEAWRVTFAPPKPVLAIAFL